MPNIISLAFMLTMHIILPVRLIIHDYATTTISPPTSMQTLSHHLHDTVQQKPDTNMPGLLLSWAVLLETLWSNRTLKKNVAGHAKPLN